ncbi:MAG: FAD-dependent oxidoreductase [Saccharolobus sp.]
MNNKTVIILGGGYAGLNAFYELKNYKKILLSEKNEFTFYTAYLRNIILNKNNKYVTAIKTDLVDKVKEVDAERRIVKTINGRELQADYLILALGCNRGKQLETIRKIIAKNKISLQAENYFDEYLAIQMAFYLKLLGKDVSYSGPILKWLGENISNLVRSTMEKYGIRIVEKPEDIIPSCEPNEVFGEFLPINYKLEYKNNVFAIGDLIKDYPKLGELAMREGIFVGKLLSGANNSVSFKPIYINIIDTGKGEAIHIRSDIPWGGNFISAKKSRLRSIMKRFIEKYYIIRKGKMGILYHL